jgi:hypothetical protein
MTEKWCRAQPLKLPSRWQPATAASATVEVEAAEPIATAAAI